MGNLDLDFLSTTACRQEALFYIEYTTDSKRDGSFELGYAARMVSENDTACFV